MVDLAGSGSDVAVVDSTCRVEGFEGAALGWGDDSGASAEVEREAVGAQYQRRDAGGQRYLAGPIG